MTSSSFTNGFFPLILLLVLLIFYPFKIRLESNRWIYTFLSFFYFFSFFSQISISISFSFSISILSSLIYFYFFGSWKYRSRFIYSSDSETKFSKKLFSNFYYLSKDQEADLFSGFESHALNNSFYYSFYSFLTFGISGLTLM